MYHSIGFLGCGTIGRSMFRYVSEEAGCEAAFIQDPFIRGEEFPCPVAAGADEELLKRADLVVECASAAVLKENLEPVLRHADLLLFSVTAFADPEFARQAEKLSRHFNRKIYIPHGAILGIDGLYDGRSLVKKVTIETLKNPKSLGREDTERTVLFEGPTRQACPLFPRNVNVHATIALAGIGFDRTVSRIICDPAVSTNSHRIHIEGAGIDFTLHVSSTAGGGVTGAYTPVSAVGSLRRVLGAQEGCVFV